MQLTFIRKFEGLNVFVLLQQLSLFQPQSINILIIERVVSLSLVVLQIIAISFWTLAFVSLISRLRISIASVMALVLIVLICWSKSNKCRAIALPPQFL